MKFESNTNYMFETEPGYDIFYTLTPNIRVHRGYFENTKYCNNNNLKITYHSLVYGSGTITQILETGRLKFPEIAFTKTERTNPLESAYVFITRPRGH